MLGGGGMLQHETAMNNFCLVNVKLMMLNRRLAEIILNWDSSVSTVPVCRLATEELWLDSRKW